MTTPGSESSAATSAATTAAAATTTHAKTAPTSVPASFKSLDDFHKKAPKEYMAFLNGIAQGMISQLKKAADRVKEAMKKNRQNS